MQGAQTFDPHIEKKHCKYIYIKYVYQYVTQIYYTNIQIYIYLYVKLTPTQQMIDDNHISHLATTIILS